MISNAHKKHSDLARPAYGNFCRNEWAILGAPCEVIKQLADAIISALSAKYKCAYADTTHSDNQLLPGRLAGGAAIEYTDQINYAQFNYAAKLDIYKQRALFFAMDLVLVNGNHQQAKAQVIIIDSNKQASLHKRVNQLDNVQLILLAEGIDEPFDFIKEALPGWQQIPVLRLNQDLKNVINFFEHKLHEAKPVLNGLVLAGGKSVRMGLDKGTINWHGKQQQYYVADLIQEHCNKVYISCRDDEQSKGIDADYLTITDSFTGLGPLGAILSAFRAQPDSAWLVIACDLPLLNSNTVRYLVDHRNPSTIATAFQSQDNDFPEPLITIYEPKSYPVLLQFLAQGYSCPRKVLINSEVTLLQSPVADALMNVNTPADMDDAKSKLYANSNTMQAELSRYSCQMALPGFGEAAQEKLRLSKVLVIGAGGLGCPAAQYLASSGIGTLGIADYDMVSVSNLHRQILYTPGDVGLLKSVIACERLKKQNPEINLLAITEKITADNIMQIISGYDVLVDCTDNFDARYLVNDAAVLTGKPVIYGAIYQYEGQVAVWNIVNVDGSRSANYRDLYPQVNASQIPNCSDGGVMPVLAGLIGCLQAAEVIKWITGTGELLSGKLLVFDVQTMQSHIIKLRPVSKQNITGLTPSVTVSTITANELQKGLAGNDFQLVDVRADYERDQFDIGGIHIEVDEIHENLHEFSPGKTYVFYCSSGKRSAEAVKLLQKHLPEIKSFSLDKGLKSWVELTG